MNGCGFGGCWWIIILILIFCCGCGGYGNGCGGCGNGCGGCGCDNGCGGCGALCFAAFFIYLLFPNAFQGVSQ